MMKNCPICRAKIFGVRGEADATMAERIAVCLHCDTYVIYDLDLGRLREATPPEIAAGFASISVPKIWDGE